LFWLRTRLRFINLFAVLYLSYALHVILDFFTFGGRGVMLLWPLTAQRFEAPFILFYGVRWSEGFLAVAHLTTLLTELGFVLIVWLILRILETRKRLPGESEPIYKLSQKQE
jgi:membrane-bound metal-dependent hydrolase YbcI (DUF457 family)